jgi:branched-subunit amino acid transport protein
MELRYYLPLLLAMGCVTYVPRLLPLLFLSRRNPPQWFVDWLDLIPAAILSALLFPELITAGEPRHLDVSGSEFLVAIPVFAFAWKTRSLGGTVIFGMLLYWLAGRLL